MLQTVSALLIYSVVSSISSSVPYQGLPVQHFEYSHSYPRIDRMRNIFVLAFAFLASVSAVSATKGPKITNKLAFEMEQDGKSLGTITVCSWDWKKRRSIR